MRSLLPALAAVLMPACAFAFDQAALDQLKDTKECQSCDLRGADFRWANVYAAELGGAPNLVNADMSGADLSGANFYGANLEGAKLRGANLEDADLSWASLIGADLSKANIEGVKIRGATFCNTIMPDGTENDDNC